MIFRPQSLTPQLLFHLALLLLWHPVFAKDEAPAVTNAACLECHADNTLDMKKAGKKISLFVDEASFKKSVHASLACVDCHENFNPEGQPHKTPMSSVDCGSCHESLGKAHSFHKNLALPASPKGADTACASCHGSHDIKTLKSPDSPFARPLQNETCGKCHQTQKQTLLSSAHGKKHPARKTTSRSAWTATKNPSSPRIQRFQTSQSN